jgi:hypothetical protein
MDSLILQGILHTKYHHPFRKIASNIEQGWQEIALTLKNHLQKLEEHIKTKHIDYHFLCSTINCTSFLSNQYSWYEIKNTFSIKKIDIRSLLYIDMYECASWGYALRYYLSQGLMSTQVLVSIADINFYDFDHFVKNADWGESGFGITTLLFKRDRYSNIDLTTGCATGNTPITEFAFSVREKMKIASEFTAALPFFPPQARDVLTRIFGHYQRLPDLHEKWGHCFGSDPWIAILQNLRNPDAVNGYYTLLKTYIAKDVIFDQFSRSDSQEVYS